MTDKLPINGILPWEVGLQQVLDAGNSKDWSHFEKHSESLKLAENPEFIADKTSANFLVRWR